MITPTTIAFAIIGGATVFGVADSVVTQRPVIDTTNISLAVIAVATAFGAYFNYRQKAFAQKTEAALAAQDVKLAKAEVVQEKIHILTNSNMGATLKSLVVALKSDQTSKRRLAESSKQEADVAALRASDEAVLQAEAQVLAHEVQQGKVDAKAEITDKPTK